MNFLNKFLLNRYRQISSEKYLVAKNLSFILLTLWCLFVFLIIKYSIVLNASVLRGVLLIFIIINISLILVRQGHVYIAAPISLLGINFLSSLIIFTIQVPQMFEVYIVATFQLSVLIISSLITYRHIYANIMMSIGIITLTIHLLVRGLQFNRDIVVANFEDYIIASILILLCGFILRVVIKEKTNMIHKLRMSEEKYASVVNNSKDGILIHRKGIVKFANKAIVDLIGSPPENLLEESVLKFVHPDDIKFAISRLEMSRSCSNLRDTYEIKLNHMSGFAIDVEVKRSEFLFEGKRASLVFIRDITERKKLNEKLVQSEKLLSLGGLAAGMAHDINNPLAGIIQNTQLVLKRLGEDFPANTPAAESAGIDLAKLGTYLRERKVFDQLERIRDAGCRAAEMVSNMLDYSRMENAKSTQNLVDLLEKTVEIASNSSAFRSIEITRDYDTSNPMVHCDPGQIQQVFINILKNGTEAMSEAIKNGAKDHNAEFILSVKKIDDLVRVKIKNNICGIPEELLGRIFKPFYTTKPAGVGTGLGLSISHYIITEIHKGKIYVESNGIDQVSFIIELPFSP